MPLSQELLDLIAVHCPRGFQMIDSLKAKDYTFDIGENMLLCAVILWEVLQELKTP